MADLANDSLFKPRAEVCVPSSLRDATRTAVVVTPPIDLLLKRSKPFTAISTRYLLAEVGAIVFR
jgi:hypothetical protein